MESFSHSRLKTLDTCPRQYEFRYVKKEKEAFTSVEAFVGTTVHAVLAWLYQERMDGRSPAVSTAEERYEAVFAETLSPRIKVIRKNDSIEARRAAGRSMVRAFHGDVFAGDRSETLALETRLTRAFDEETAYLGILDRVARTPEGIVRIVDFKTGKSVPSELDDETAEQLRSYGWLYMAEHGADAVELRYRYLVDGSQLDELMPAHAAAAVAERIRERIRAARARDSFPANPSALCAWCGFRDVCDVSGFSEAGASCPRCGGALRRRKGRFGEFLGCSGYPKCRYTRNP